MQELRKEGQIFVSQSLDTDCLWGGDITFVKLVPLHGGKFPESHEPSADNTPRSLDP